MSQSAEGPANGEAAAFPLGRPAGDHGGAAALLSAALLRDVQIDLDRYRAVLRENPRLIVTIIHEGLVSFVPMALVMQRATAICEPGRRIVGTAHPIAWKIPGWSAFIRAMSGSTQHVGFLELLRAYQAGEQFDYYAFPESENCLYGDITRVRPFRFHGFLEIALRTNVPLLLVAERGTAPWYRRIDVGERGLRGLERLPDKAFAALELNKKAFLGALRTYGSINLPLRFRRLNMRVAMEVHRPRVDRELSASYRERQRQLADEGERIRARMQALYDALS
jgi:hypothetical protein